MARSAILRMINGATAPAVSNVFSNNTSYLCAMQVTGTYSTATVKLQGMIDTDGNNWTDIAVFNLSNLELKPNSQGNGIYHAAIEGVLRIRMNVTAVDGGDISVVANFVG